MFFTNIYGDFANNRRGKQIDLISIYHGMKHPAHRNHAMIQISRMLNLISPSMSTFNKTGLSKSSFIRGCQCPKALYLHKYAEIHEVARDELDASTEAIFATGHRVGELAQQRHPGGKNAQPEDGTSWGPGIENTAQWMKDGEPVIYEAAFSYNGLFCACDIVVKDGGGWIVHEVKSSTSTKEVNIIDAAAQLYILNGLGYQINDITITYLNNQYVRHGELNVDQLFTSESVMERAMELQDMVAENVIEFKALLQKSEVPDVKIGNHCSNPYTCDFMGHCWSHVPSYSVFNLTRGGGRGWDLYSKGIMEIKNIPSDYPLTRSQQIQVSAEQTGLPIIHADPIRNWLEQIKHPIGFLDFETINPAVPDFEGTRPYQQICFQWSNHKRFRAHHIEHEEFLAISGTDPREEFCKTLIESCKGLNTILVYNISFEDTRLRELQEQLPHYEKELQSIRDRLLDLAVPFSSKWYYHPAMRGSYSIKLVLPALVPELSYKDLVIQEGGTASQTFYNLQFVKDPEIVANTRKHLLEYCKLDTLAMVRLYDVLRKI